MLWCQDVLSDYTNVKIENFQSRCAGDYASDLAVTVISCSFRDGLAFNAIIHHYFPNLIDYDLLSSEVYPFIF